MTTSLNFTPQLPYTLSRPYLHTGSSKGDSKKFTLLCKLSSTVQSRTWCLEPPNRLNYQISILIRLFYVVRKVLQHVNFTMRCKLLSTFCRLQNDAASSNYLFGNLCMQNQLHKCAQMLKSVIYEITIPTRFNTKITHMKNSVTCAQAEKCTSMHK